MFPYFFLFRGRLEMYFICPRNLSKGSKKKNGSRYRDNQYLDVSIKIYEGLVFHIFDIRYIKSLTSFMYTYFRKKSDDQSSDFLC